MNTKYFFLLLISLLISSASSSVSTNKKTTPFTTDDHHSVVITPPVPQDNKAKSPLPVDWESKHQKNKVSGHHHTEEDGKHHHIHFNRLTQQGKRRYIRLAMAKFIIIITHLSLLIYCFKMLIH